MEKGETQTATPGRTRLSSAVALLAISYWMWTAVPIVLLLLDRNADDSPPLASLIMMFCYPLGMAFWTTVAAVDARRDGRVPRAGRILLAGTPLYLGELGTIVVLAWKSADLPKLVLLFAGLPLLNLCAAAAVGIALRRSYEAEPDRV